MTAALCSPALSLVGIEGGPPWGLALGQGRSWWLLCPSCFCSSCHTTASRLGVLQEAQQGLGRCGEKEKKGPGLEPTSS